MTDKKIIDGISRIIEYNGTEEDKLYLEREISKCNGLICPAVLNILYDWFSDRDPSKKKIEEMRAREKILLREALSIIDNKG